nr:PREDICTED: amiloride-sensitive sodium channel subunit gamma [Opisthocomus hoazin]
MGSRYISHEWRSFRLPLATPANQQRKFRCKTTQPRITALIESPDLLLFLLLPPSSARPSTLVLVPDGEPAAPCPLARTQESHFHTLCPLGLADTAFGERGSLAGLSQYSSMKDYLSELDKETKKALETFYGFSEGKSKVRRSVEEWNSTGSDLFKQIPLLKFEDFSKTATDLRSGQKRRVEGSVFHKDSSIVNSGDSNDIIGFQLCDANNSSECALYTFSSGVNAIQEWYKLHYMNIMAQIPLETKEKLSYSADDLLLTCFFDGLSCDKRHFTRFHHPLHGNCYTFNSGENGTVLSTSTAGSEYGLQVVLFIDEADYNPFLVTSTGAKIIVHDQNEYPFIEDIGTEIETAAVTSIGMHFTRSRKLSKPYSDCTETGADIPVENLYNKSYSLQICLHSCFQKAMVDSCGCAQYAQPLPAGAEYCNYKKNPNWMYCYYRLHEKFVKEQLGCQQICKDACSFKEWALTTSIAQWPSAVSEDWMLRVLSWDKGQKINKKLNKTDLANLMVFYKDLNERFISENPANTLVILLSNFGGQLGLWMSCSVVCVIEIVEVFFIDSLSIVMRRQWQKAKRWWNHRQQERLGKPPQLDQWGKTPGLQERSMTSGGRGMTEVWEEHKMDKRKALELNCH